MQVRHQNINTAAHDERDVDVYGACLGQHGNKVRKQWILATLNEWERVGWSRGIESHVGEWIGSDMWEHVTDAAAWVRSVADVPWDQVEVKVWNGLAGGGSDVDANIVAVRMVRLLNEVPSPFDTGDERPMLVPSGLEPALDMAMGHE
ncbi:MAG: hypothetical protein NTY23_12680 [Chloroflexi bacterium]|nr:hypothetical protein [Chloroflexota bacterium]